MPDKPLDTIPVYRVTFKSCEDSEGYDYVKYIDPNADIDLAEEGLALTAPAKWYVLDEKTGAYVPGEDGWPEVFDGNVTDHDVDAIAGIRVFFTGETETITVTGTVQPRGAGAGSGSGRAHDV